MPSRAQQECRDRAERVRQRHEPAHARLSDADPPQARLPLVHLVTDAAIVELRIEQREQQGPAIVVDLRPGPRRQLLDCLEHAHQRLRELESGDVQHSVRGTDRLAHGGEERLERHARRRGRLAQRELSAATVVDARCFRTSSGDRRRGGGPWWSSLAPTRSRPGRDAYDGRHRRRSERRPLGSRRRSDVTEGWG